MGISPLISISDSCLSPPARRKGLTIVNIVSIHNAVYDQRRFIAPINTALATGPLIPHDLANAFD